MTANYGRPAFPGSFFKAARGTATLKKEKAEKAETDEELLVKKDVRARDVKCRWPERHRCRHGMEVIHVKDKSLGGEYLSSNLWLGCGWIHRKGLKTIHSKDLAVEPIDPKRGCDGPMKFYHQVFNEATGERKRKLIAKESAPGVIQK